MGKKSSPADDLKAAFSAWVDEVTENFSSVGVDGDSDDDGDDEDVAVYDREEVEALGIKELREVASELGIDEKKKADILAAMEEAGHFGDEEDEDEEEEDDEDEDSEDEDEDEESDEEEEDEDEEDEDDEEAGYDRDELAELDLKELRKLCKEEGHSAADVKGLDQDALIDLLMGEDEEDEEEEDEDEDTEELDEDALKAMSVKELRDLAKELEIKVTIPRTANTDAKKKKILVKTILDSGEDE